MQAVKLPSVDWHWEQPVWPSRVHAVEWFARRFLLWRCVRCGLEAIGDDGQKWMQRHMEIQHPGKTPIYTAYPISVGLRPMGHDG